MRNLLTWPAVAVAILGLQAIVDSQPVKHRSLHKSHIVRDITCQGSECPVDPALLVPRAPAGAFRIAAPKGEPHTSGPGAHGTGSDPVSEPGSPGGAPPRIGAGEGGGEGSPDGGNGPPRIAADQPGGGAAPHPEGAPAPQPNEGPPLIGESKPYGDLAAKGPKVDGERATAITNNDPDVELPKLKEKYNVRDESTGQRLDTETANKGPDDATPDKDLSDPLRDAGIDTGSAKYSSSSVFSDKDAPTDQVVARGKFFDQDGVIIGEERFAGNDKVKAMKPSDILWSQYSNAASHMTQLPGRAPTLKAGMTNDVGRLRAFVGRNIQSRSAVETMQTAHTKTGQDPKKPGIFPREPPKDKTPEQQQAYREAFDALSGTDSLSSVNYMLKDHHAAAGNKQINEIRTYPYNYDPATKTGQQKVAILAKMDPA